MAKLSVGNPVRVVRLGNHSEAKIGDTGVVQNVDALGPWEYYVKMDKPIRINHLGKPDHHEWFMGDELELITDAPPKVKRGKGKQDV